MGIYDRDYYHYSGHGREIRLSLPIGPNWRTSATAWLIGITVGVFFLQIILRKILHVPAEPHEPGLLACSPKHVVEGFQVWRVLTGAFCHSLRGLGHIFFNMLIVFFFGPRIERLYGRKDFVGFYLFAAVFGNLVYILWAYAVGDPTVPVIGASGVCIALVVLSALYFPQQLVIVLFIPVRLWALATFFVAVDLFRLLMGVETGTADQVHLAGAAFGFVFRYVDLRYSTFVTHFSRARLKRRVRRAFRERASDKEGPSDGVPRFTDDVERQRLDRILEKISRFGKESLTQEEIRFLNRMSEQYRGKR